MFRTEIVVKSLSPCFCAGADQNRPEIRAPSIRGHLRRWHGLLYGEEEMKSVWGSVGKRGGSSKVQLRVEVLSGDEKQGVLLPHKHQGGGSRMALESARFAVSLASRNRKALETAGKVLEVWSLLGALGTRANRAAGSIWPDESAPVSSDGLRSRLQEAGLKKCDIRVSAEYDRVDVLRTSASNTLSIPHLFGSASKTERKPSPLKIKMVEFSDGVHLLLWAVQPGVIDSALTELEKKKKPLAKFSWQKIR